MPTNRVSANITLEITATSNFMFSSEADLSVIRGGNAVTDVINWMQGIPALTGIAAASFSLIFYTDSTFGTVLDTGADYSIGNQDLDEIVTLETFVDSGGGSGTIVISLDPSSITATELTADTNIYARLQVSQPDSDD